MQGRQGEVKLVSSLILLLSTVDLLNVDPDINKL
jgi:hypothetical protein